MLPLPPVPVSPRADLPSRIAIVGMSAILPGARNLQTYWENILAKVDAIVEIPKDRWDWKLYYDPDPAARDKIYSRWGGFIDDVPFDPVEYGMPPNSLPSIDPMQLLALAAARAALEDAGYVERAFDRSRASVILGASGGSGDLGTAYLLRASLPLLFGAAAPEVLAAADGILPEWTEDSFAGLLPNVAAGRISNRLDFGGLNYVVDAACASSLSAVHVAVKELETGSTDLVIAGGFDTTQNPFGYLCFSKTQALSPTGRPRTFDASADGIVIGEGVVMLVLKRLADAERDGDRVYAVIRAVEGSSDGRAKGLTAPRPEGQILAFERTYAKADVCPTTVGLFEGHGTGTVVGDLTEALALSTFLANAGASPRSSAIGSVKSMIGHTKAAAGVAGLAKIALALYHRVLPPTLGVTRPNPKAGFGDGPLYINSETRPWVHAVPSHPRRAGVSAFGFGGTNFHAVMEECAGETLSRPAPLQQWPSELLLWSAGTARELLAEVTSLEGALRRGARPRLRDLAYTLWQIASEQIAGGVGPGRRLAIVAGSLDELCAQLGQAREALGAPDPALHDPSGIYLARTSAAPGGRLAVLFPGEGSQYPNMLRDLTVIFSEIREEFERADQVLVKRFPRPLSHYVFPPPAFGTEEARAQREGLIQTGVAQSAVGAANLALYRLLRTLGVTPDLVGGHRCGEYAALCAAGVLDAETVAVLSEATATPERLTGCLETVELGAPRLEVFSGTTAMAYPPDPRAIAALLAEHLGRPARFRDELESMYQAGARVFVEVGPQDELTALVPQVLRARPHLAIAVDVAGRPGLAQLQHALGRLAVHGVPVNLDRLFQGRTVRRLNPSVLEDETKDTPLPATAWLVNGSRARPAHQPARGPERPGVRLSSFRALPSGRDGQAAMTPPAPAPLAPSLPAPVRTPAGAPETTGPRPARPTRAPGNDASGPVMLGFQGLMDRFLETQRNVLMTYLHGRTGAAGRPAAAPAPRRVSPPAGVPVSSPRPEVLRRRSRPEPAGLDASRVREASGQRQNPTAPEPTDSAARVAAPRRTPTGNALPLLRGATISSRAGHTVEVVRILDPSHDLYLQDHRLDGKPVLPVAMAIELMAEVAQHGWQDLQVVGLRDLRVLRGVVLDSGPKPFRLVARAPVEPPHEEGGVDVSVEIRDAEGSAPPYYRTTIELGVALPEPPPHWSPPSPTLSAFPLTAAEAYREWLFHGPLFQGLVQIDGISEHGMVAACRPSSPRQCLAGDTGGEWLIDPVVFDSGLQLIILWARARHDQTPLPSGCRRYRRLGSLAQPLIHCHLQVGVTPDGHSVHGNLFFLGPDGRLLGMLEDLECTGSKTLNRLAGGHRRA